MNTLHRKLAAGILVPWLAFGTAAVAQQQQQAPTAGAPPLTAEQLALLDVRASELIGKDVTNPQGQDLGRIEDLIIDVANSQVRYAIVSHGGVLGIGNQMAAFPPVMFRPGREEGEVMLNVSQQQLEQAPRFDAREWPDWNEESYRGQVDRFFWQDDEVIRKPSGSRLARASDVIGKRVNDGGGRHAGSIEDIVVNLGNGHLRYAVLDYSATRFGIGGGHLVPLPIAAFRFPTRPDIPIFLVLDRERVEQARAFDRDNWPDLSDARQRMEMDAYLSQFPRGGSPAAQAQGQQPQMPQGQQDAQPRQAQQQAEQQQAEQQQPQAPQEQARPATGNGAGQGAGAAGQR
ncbi:MAG TPA: PRC-barrel domain-containing protein [Noviherbaspirillum sp.]|nr:PRC-barrel domain-containing protein [Noviherbaspirillum sp.]